ncbi:DUF5819 family protein [Actinospica sp.]|uniref:DUF5819 family protein n=1 Tax=Actinospica sp. TaxID=1872142 RepID=UPI002C29905C|nr:DUF5819 family protein [Actinospica sp.]HWG24134.1 DUF5819 family protein [Actinospica sp.]
MSEQAAISTARRPTRRWSRAVVGVTVLVTLILVAIQMSASFLYNAPGNVISKKYAAQVSWWMTPLQMQNWQLFAPNPISENLEIDARASVGPSAAVSPWVDLSAIDAAATDGNPVPSHLTMNATRNAWLKFVETHTSTGIPNAGSPLAATAQAYLQNLVLGYLRPRESGTIDSVQVRFIITLLPGDGRTAAQTAPQAQTLPWWLVAR